MALIVRGVINTRPRPFPPRRAHLAVADEEEVPEAEMMDPSIRRIEVAEPEEQSSQGTV